MRKRGLKRIPQDVLPWARVTKIQEDTVNIFTKKQAHWTSGNRRQAQTKLFNIHKVNSLALTLNQFQTNDARLVNRSELFAFQNSLRGYKLSAFKGRALAKNFCLFLGQGQTYNRKLFISRQAVRKLVKTGLISGLQK